MFKKLSGLFFLLLSGSVILNAQQKITAYTTAQNAQYKLTQTATAKFEPFGQPVETQVCVFIDNTKTFQTFIGVGGALTDAAAETFFKLSKDKQNELLDAYYDKDKGIAYALARTNINSCDFSSDTYTYVDENDQSLKTFNIKHDLTYKIPLIKAAMKAAGGNLKLFVSPWSPPGWMKDNHDMLHGGKLLNQYRDAWANYYVKFIKAYEKEQIPVWGLSVQNEPMAKQSWESCIFTGTEERDFIKEFLGPTLKKNGLGDKKLIAWDHNRDLVYQRASTILNDAQAAKYVWGIGYHWYETWTGSAMQFENLKRVAETFPDKNLFFTEGCAEAFNFNNINSWKLGEKYGMSMIGDFNAGTVGWTDWNVLLDETGGPNHVGNFCFSPIIADTKTNTLYYTNAYYYIGHFSKFIKPGAKRIISSSNRDVLQTTAFKNPDGSLVVVVLNTTDQNMPYNLWLKGDAAGFTSMPHSIMTLVVAK